jgi:putative copper export protein
MKTAATRPAGTKNRWRFAIWLILAAFTLQSYVVQTHIHDAAPAAISKAFTTTGHGKSPVDNSPLDCPFCQAALSSAFALSATPLVFLSAAGIFLAALDHPAASSYDTVAHIWRSRAPPQQ